jgi:branched-chain amino acid aminotransferase
VQENWLIYVNGEMVPMQEAKISVFDRGFQYGDAVFEGLRAYSGRIFKLREHIDRLFHSAAFLNIQVPLSKQQFCDAVKRVVRENNFQNAHIKPQVTRGTAWKLGLDPRNTTTPNVIIPARPIGKSLFDTAAGFKLASVSVRKIPAVCIDPRVKSCNYVVNILARAEALASGADEAIMLDMNGYVSEGAGANIFLVKQGALYTPPAESALAGITRSTVLELASAAKIPAHETRLTIYDIYTADEIFLTGTGAGIVPVTEVDGRQVARGKRGEVTARVEHLYDEQTLVGESAYD